jgi:hypothetical protein
VAKTTSGAAHSFCCMLAGQQESAMFGIEWLRYGALVERETSASMLETDAIASAKRRAAEVAARHPERRPDSFRLTDAAGNVFGVFPIDGRGDDVH